MVRRRLRRTRDHDILFVISRARGERPGEPPIPTVLSSIMSRNDLRRHFEVPRINLKGNSYEIMARMFEYESLPSGSIGDRVSREDVDTMRQTRVDYWRHQNWR